MSQLIDVMCLPPIDRQGLSCTPLTALHNDTNALSIVPWNGSEEQYSVSLLRNELVVLLEYRSCRRMNRYPSGKSLVFASNVGRGQVTSARRSSYGI
jgi:hypothetical protein